VCQGKWWHHRKVRKETESEEGEENEERDVIVAGHEGVSTPGGE